MEPDAHVEPDRADLHDEPAPQRQDQSGGDESGQSTGDVLTMCLFGVMVVIASVCFVIW